jgi:tetratricopeptide (TPR) repeat protein
MVLLAHRFTETAAICFAQAEHLDPHNPRWPYYRGQTLMDADLDAAIPVLKRAANASGGAPDAPRLLFADVLATRGHLDEAAAQYMAVLAMDPGNVRAHLGLARVAYTRNELAEALTQLGFSGTDVRTRKATASLMASILRAQGNANAADEQLKQVSALPADAEWSDPFSQEVNQLRTGRKANCDQARQLYATGFRKEAINLLQRTVRDYPHSDVAWLMLGQALIGEDDWPGAEQSLRAAVREAPESDENLQYLGMALAGKHDDRAAAASFRKATELRPENAEVQILLGQCLKRLNDNAGAVRAFRAAIRYQPQIEDAHVLLAETLLGQGNAGEALLQVRQALQLNPTSQKANDLLHKVTANQKADATGGSLP